MNKLFALYLFLFAGFAQATTVTIDFEEFAAGEPGSIDSKGYTIDAYGSGGFYCSGPGCGSGEIVGTIDKYFIVSGAETPPVEGFEIYLSISRQDSSNFAIYSFDAASSFGNDLFITAWLSDGSTISGQSSDLGTGQWLNIETAEFYLGSPSYCCGWEVFLEVDNIVVGAAVPIPAAVWLFGSALAGLGWIRRKQAA
ncbi:MAG: VPLPA-CTERM sorting domain-containing protein [Gammaproteobacteria bacterium]|uniref:VPLPA-CTERM sorting domain-containing protein n=1 Tax=Oceanicoccus sp. TaxID=2691044 RepID=UPI0026117891|nr:VPLPA-CTERM sorting domain-containing protein [Oceanicoccus sp.]MCP3906470.1 VPLPA-CTERM sorting domain-containing protein [Oceanicoccus sp.]MCP4278286.1 VPLPA-CTERM sorting domain-containing protein [Gammaproteobacteria bacterium]MCP4790157.1 VPLPA-CTERM sorting domain-containing protein [Gammaproteobacteria bacterium]MCP4929065.1 VPLPA-CTERM sorting domain-containing protein [Gammaproteobacteria bacterium]